MTTTNLPHGVTNNTKQNCLGEMIQLDPSIMHTYFNDFDNYVETDWIVTESEPEATQTITDGDGGILLLTNSSDDNELVAIQKVGESFKFEAGKKLFFKARFKLSDATNSDAIIGLQITDTTPFDVTDGVYFIKNDDAATLDFKVVKNSTATTASSILTMANDTYITIGFYYDGGRSGYIKYYGSTNTLNPTFLGQIATTNLVDDEELTVSIALRNGEAVAKTMSIDYVLISKDR